MIHADFTTGITLSVYLGYGKGRAPLLLENVKTDASVAVDVRMENLCSERNLYRGN